MTGSNTDLWNVDNSFTRDVISDKFYSKKNCLHEVTVSFVYERLLLLGSASLCHYILASFAEEISDCRDCRILHSDSKAPAASNFILLKSEITDCHLLLRFLT